MLSVLQVFSPRAASSRVALFADNLHAAGHAGQQCQFRFLKLDNHREGRRVADRASGDRRDAQHTAVYGLIGIRL